MLARRGFAAEHFYNVDALAQLACASSPGRNAEKICQAYKFSSLGSRRQRGWPTEQQRNAAGRLKEVLFLPAVMIAEQIAVVGEKTDENVPRIWSRFDCIENSPEAIVQISHLAVITRLHDFS